MTKQAQTGLETDSQQENTAINRPFKFKADIKKENTKNETPVAKPSGNPKKKKSKMAPWSLAMKSGAHNLTWLKSADTPPVGTYTIKPIKRPTGLVEFSRQPISRNQFYSYDSRKPQNSAVTRKTGASSSEGLIHKRLPDRSLGPLKLRPTNSSIPEVSSRSTGSKYRSSADHRKIENIKNISFPGSTLEPKGFVELDKQSWRREPRIFYRDVNPVVGTPRKFAKYDLDDFRNVPAVNMAKGTSREHKQIRVRVKLGLDFYDWRVKSHSPGFVNYGRDTGRLQFDFFNNPNKENQEKIKLAGMIDSFVLNTSLPVKDVSYEYERSINVNEDSKKTVRNKVVKSLAFETQTGRDIKDFSRLGAEYLPETEELIDPSPAGTFSHLDEGTIGGDTAVLLNLNQGIITYEELVLN